MRRDSSTEPDAFQHSHELSDDNGTVAGLEEARTAPETHEIELALKERKTGIYTRYDHENERLICDDKSLKEMILMVTKGDRHLIEAIIATPSSLRKHLVEDKYKWIRMRLLATALDIAENSDTEEMKLKGIQATLAVIRSVNSDKKGGAYGGKKPRIDSAREVTSQTLDERRAGQSEKELLGMEVPSKRAKGSKG